MYNIMIFASLMIFAFAGVVLAQNTSKNIKTDQEFSLGANEIAYLSSGALTIEFVSVPEDSRCPPDVDCVWAGNAKVQIKIAKGEMAAQFFELNTNLEPRFVMFECFKIEITDLSPVPKSDDDKKTVKYTATFIVRKN